MLTFSSSPCDPGKILEMSHRRQAKRQHYLATLASGEPVSCSQLALKRLGNAKCVLRTQNQMRLLYEIR
jgi:hypothetical protein